MDIFQEIKQELLAHASQEKASILQRFFKTNKGEYGEGDIFIGITVPIIRGIAKKFQNQVLTKEVTLFLHSKIHEERLLALLILIEKFQQAKREKDENEVVEFYVDRNNLSYVNNWDLVDASCYKILGSFLTKHPNEADILYKFAKDNDLWVKRIAIVSTLAFIRKGQFSHTINLADILIKDSHNLIHKATGWMLREVGKKDKKTLLDFLNKNHSKMPRIALSYAIERLSAEEKTFYARERSVLKKRGNPFVNRFYN